MSNQVILRAPHRASNKTPNGTESGEASGRRWLYGRVSLHSALRSPAGSFFYANPSDAILHSCDFVRDLVGRIEVMVHEEAHVG
jgi:hypothetical protein